MTPPNTELAACPFCGKSPKLYPKTEYVFCENGDCPIFDTGIPLLLWNTRHLATLREDKGVFKIGDTVRKKGNKGQWRGFIVGTYSTKCTPEGYAVESVYEDNSVQIYPASALEPWVHDISALKNPSDAGGDYNLKEMQDLWDMVVIQETGIQKESFMVNWLRGQIKIPEQVQIRIKNKDAEDFLLCDNLTMFKALGDVLRVCRSMDCLDGDNLEKATQIENMCNEAIKGNAQ